MTDSNKKVKSGDDHGKIFKLKQFGERLIHSKFMLPGIGIASFLEATVIPIPLETILIPLMQARRKQIVLISTIALAGFIIAAIVGYAVGYYIFDAIGDQIVSLLSTQEEFESAKQQILQKGFWYVFSIGLAPIPFQIAMLAAGALKYSFIYFLIATTFSRGLRYYGLALLVYWAGNQAQELFERHKISTFIILIILLGIIWYLSFLS